MHVALYTLGLSNLWIIYTQPQLKGVNAEQSRVLSKLLQKFPTRKFKKWSSDLW